MAGKREKPEEVVSKLGQVGVLEGQGATIAETVHQIGVTQQTFYRWRKLYGGMQQRETSKPFTSPEVHRPCAAGGWCV